MGIPDMEGTAFITGSNGKIDKKTLEDATEKEMKMEKDLVIRDIAIVRIENHSDYNLEYLTSQTVAGESFGTLRNAFRGKEKWDNSCGVELDTIPPGCIGINRYDVHEAGDHGKNFLLFLTLGSVAAMDLHRVCGFFSVLVRILGKNHVVCCGFINGKTCNNKVGIQIRGEDGVLDGVGNIAGHGTNPTGSVDDVEALAGKYGHPGQFRKGTKDIEKVSEE